MKLKICSPTKNNRKTEILETLLWTKRLLFWPWSRGDIIIIFLLSEIRNMPIHGLCVKIYRTILNYQLPLLSIHCHKLYSLWICFLLKDTQPYHHINFLPRDSTVNIVQFDEAIIMISNAQMILIWCHKHKIINTLF